MVSEDVRDEDDDTLGVGGTNTVCLQGTKRGVLSLGLVLTGDGFGGAASFVHRHGDAEEITN